MFKESTLRSAFVDLDLRLPDPLFAELRRAYSEPDRHYHTTQHIDACLKALHQFRSEAQAPAEISIALWFHDAVYDSHREDNEEQSAEWALRELAKAGATSELCQRVESLILATKTHKACDPDCALMLDIDLGVLGSSPKAFAQYDQDIRREFRWVPEADYRTARAQVLQAFLDRPKIYETEAVHKELEAQARKNLEACLARLRSAR